MSRIVEEQPPLSAHDTFWRRIGSAVKRELKPYPPRPKVTHEPEPPLTYLGQPAELSALEAARHIHEALFLANADKNNHLFSLSNLKRIFKFAHFNRALGKERPPQGNDSPRRWVSKLAKDAIATYVETEDNANSRWIKTTYHKDFRATIQENVLNNGSSESWFYASLTLSKGKSILQFISSADIRSVKPFRAEFDKNGNRLS